MTQHILRHTGAKVTTVKCPKCGDIVVYNGNYFCNSFGQIEYDKEAKDVVLRKGTCDWALTQPPRSRVDRAVARQLREAGYTS